MWLATPGIFYRQGYCTDDAEMGEFDHWSTRTELIPQQAGILCIQLFSDCKKNCECVEYGPEDYRYVILSACVSCSTNARTDVELDLQSLKSTMRS